MTSETTVHCSLQATDHPNGKKGWLDLPATPEKVQREFERMGITGENYSLQIVACKVPAISENLELRLEPVNVNEANMLAHMIADALFSERIKLGYIVKDRCPESLAQIVQLAGSINAFHYLESDENYGRAYVLYRNITDETVKQHIDYEALGNGPLPNDFVDACPRRVEQNGNPLLSYYGPMDIPKRYIVWESSPQSSRETAEHQQRKTPVRRGEPQR